MNLRRVVWSTLALAAITVMLFAGATHAASPDGTRVTVPLVAPDNATWYIDTQGWAVRCPTLTTCARTTGHASQILSYSGKVWVQSPAAPFNWYIWLGGPLVKWTNTQSPVDPVPVDLSSPSGTRIPGVDSFKDKTGAVWTLAGKAGDADRAILKDGTDTAGTSISLEWLNGVVYAFTANDGWYSWNSPTWVKLAEDPNAAINAANGITVDFTVTPPPTP